MITKPTDPKPWPSSTSTETPRRERTLNPTVTKAVRNVVADKGKVDAGRRTWVGQTTIGKSRR